VKASPFKVGKRVAVPIEAKGIFIDQGGANIFTHVKIDDISFEKI